MYNPGPGVKLTGCIIFLLSLYFSQDDNAMLFSWPSWTAAPLTDWLVSQLLLPQPPTPDTDVQALLTSSCTPWHSSAPTPRRPSVGTGIVWNPRWWSILKSWTTETFLLVGEVWQDLNLLLVSTQYILRRHSMQGETGQAYKSNYLKYHNGTVTEQCSPLCERLLQQVWFGK